MKATRFLLSVSLTAIVACASGCAAEPEDASSTSCTDAPLLTRAKSASALPSWYGEDWGRAPYVTRAEAPRQEVCAKDAPEARRVMEDFSVRLKLVPTTLVAERETAKFFELSRADNGRPLRVHRCSYLERSASDGADAAEGVVLGTLTVRPITFDVAREAARYAWSLEPQGAVISDPSTIEAGVYGQDFETALVVRGDNGDEVTVRNVRITVDAFTGEIRRSSGPVTARETCWKASSNFP